MSDKSLTILAVGDLSIRMPDAESYFKFVAPTLRSGDVVFGNCECPYTAREERSFEKMYFPPGDPVSLSAFPFAGFHVLAFAENHTWDSGIPGIEDTITGLKKHGIAVVGAGMNIDEARKPVIIERNGTRFGFLAYNCVGPKEAWANPEKPGCTYINIITHLEPSNYQPETYTFAEPTSMKAMVEDVSKLRPLCDV